MNRFRLLKIIEKLGTNTNHEPNESTEYVEKFKNELSRAIKELEQDILVLKEKKIGKNIWNALLFVFTHVLSIYQKFSSQNAHDTMNKLAEFVKIHNKQLVELDVHIQHFLKQNEISLLPHSQLIQSNILGIRNLMTLGHQTEKFIIENPAPIISDIVNTPAPIIENTDPTPKKLSPEEEALRSSMTRG